MNPPTENPTKRTAQTVGLLIASLVLTLAAGCVSIPKEAPELSSTLGTRIGAMEGAHLAMLHAYMDQKRAAIDEFLVRDWVPTFAAELMQDQTYAKVWEQVCQSTNPNDRLEFLRRTGPRIQSKINAKRQEFMAPLDELERTIERRLREEYDQMKGINNAITSFLASAAKVAENRDRFLGMLGVTQDDIAVAIDKADAAVTEAVAAKDAATTGAQKLQTYEKQIKDAIAALKKK